jgi:hypothetical protein
MSTPTTSGPPQHAQHRPLIHTRRLTSREAAVNAELPDGRVTTTRTEPQGRTA